MSNLRYQAKNNEKSRTYPKFTVDLIWLSWFVCDMRKSQVERIDGLGMVHIHNESSKLPGHKDRMLGHFKSVHEVMKPVRLQNGQNCNCGICKPGEEFNWNRLAESLIA